MKTFLIGLILLLSQASLAADSCSLNMTFAADANKVLARLDDKKICSEHFLTILKEGSKFSEIDGIKIPIEYQYTLKSSENDSYLELVMENAKIGGFEVVLSHDVNSLKAIAKEIP